MAAVLVYFRADLWRIATAWVHELRVPFAARSTDANLGWFIILGTIPIAIFGFAFRNQIESGARSLYLIGTMLIAFSFVMLAAERFGSRKRELTGMDGRDGIFIGFAQALALIPGVSRSGATISAGLFRNFDRERGGPLLVPALGPGGRAERALRAQGRGRRGERRLRSDPDRDDRRLHHRLRGDRLAAALPGRTTRSTSSSPTGSRSGSSCSPSPPPARSAEPPRAAARVQDAPAASNFLTSSRK